jgi:hypothetical protein
LNVARTILLILEMPSDIHSLIENAYHIDLPAARDPEKQDV